MSGFPLCRFALVLLVTADVAASAAADGVVAADISEEVLIEEIVVTASFRDEALAAVPMSVSVVSGETILKRGAQHVEQLLNMTPNVNYAAGASRGRFLQVRGVGERSQFKDPLDPSVGLIVDGIDLSGIGLAGTLFDMQQVEVLRGPQGTTFGSSAMGGLVLLKSNVPTEQLEGAVTSGVGNYGRWHVGGVVSGPLADGLAGRIAVHQFRGDGYIKNDFTDSDDSNGYDELTVRGKLRWQAGEYTSVDLTALHVDADNGYDAFSLENTRHTSSDEPGHDRQETTAFAVQLSHMGFAPFTLEANAFWEQTDLAYGFDWDWSYLDLVGWQGGEDNVRHRESFGVDLRLISNESSRLGGAVDWVVGGYLYHRDVALNYSDRCGGCGFGPAFFSSDFATERVAAYAQFDWQAGERLLLSLGGRIEAYDDSYTDSAGVNAKPDDEMWGARFSVEYLLGDGVMVYGSVQRGYKTGGVNGQAVAAADSSANPGIADFLNERLAFDAETLVSYELGLKGQFFDDRLKLSLSAFLMQRNDMQANAWVLFPPANWRSYIDNVDDGENLGVEAEFSWQATRQLQVFGGLGILETKLGDLTVQDIATGAPLVQEGRDQAHAPGYQIFLGFDYAISANYFVSVQLEAKDAFFFSNSHNIRSEAHELVHLAAGYRGNQVDVTLWGRNLFDKDYAVRGFYFGNNPLNGWILEEYTQLGEPATFGVTAEYHF
jgi:iron complex outermembrane receptor protein